MNREEFLTKLKDILQTEADITFSTDLFDIDEWDSLSMITTVAFLDNECGQKVTVKDVQEIDTVEQLAKIAGVE